MRLPLCPVHDLHARIADPGARDDRMSDDVFTLTGQKPLSMQDFVKKNAATFTDSAKAA